MNIDIEIYMKNFEGFFEKNPDQLKQLIGNLNPKTFFLKIRNTVEKNVSEKKQLEPTRKQIIDIIVLMNGGSPVDEKKVKSMPFMNHHMGFIYLN